MNMSTITQVITQPPLSRSSSHVDPLVEEASDILRSINDINDYLSLTFAFRSTQTYFAPSVNHSTPIETTNLLGFRSNGMSAISEIVNNIRQDIQTNDTGNIELTYRPWSLHETRSITNYADSIANQRVINEDMTNDVREEIRARHENSSHTQVMIYNPTDNLRNDAIYYDYNVANNLFGSERSTVNVKYILNRERSYVSKCILHWDDLSGCQTYSDIFNKIDKAEYIKRFSISEFHQEMVKLYEQISTSGGNLVDKYGGLNMSCDLFKSHLYLSYYARSLESNKSFIELKNEFGIDSINDELYNINDIDHILGENAEGYQFSKFFGDAELTPCFTIDSGNMFDGNHTFCSMYVKRNMLQWLFLNKGPENVKTIRNILDNINRTNVNESISIGASTGEVSEVNMVHWTVGGSRNLTFNNTAASDVFLIMNDDLKSVNVPVGFPIILVGDAIVSFDTQDSQHAPGSRMPDSVSITQLTSSEFDVAHHARMRAKETRGNRQVEPIMNNLNELLTSPNTPLGYQANPILNVQDDYNDDIVISKFDGSWVMDSSVTEGRCRLSSMVGVSGISGLHTVRLEWSLSKTEVGLFSDKEGLEELHSNMNFYNDHAESVSVNNDSFRIIVAFNDAKISKVDGRVHISLNERDVYKANSKPPIIVTVNGKWTFNSDVGDLNINDIVHTTRRPGEFGLRNARGFLNALDGEDPDDFILGQVDTGPWSVQVGLSPTSVFDEEWIDDKTFVSDSLSVFQVWMASHSNMIRYATREDGGRDMNDVKMKTTITNRSTGFISTVMKDHLEELKDKFDAESGISKLISRSRCFFNNSYSDGVDTSRIALASADDLDAFYKSGNTSHGIEPIFGKKILESYKKIKASNIDVHNKQRIDDSISDVKKLYAEIPKPVSITNELYSGLSTWYVTELYNKMMKEEKYKLMIEELIEFTKKRVYESVVRDRTIISYEDYVKLMDYNVGVALDTAGGVNETIIDPNSNVLWFRAAITQCVKIIYSKSGNERAVNKSGDVRNSSADEAVINFSKRTLMSLFNPTFTPKSKFGAHGLYFGYAVERDFWGATRASHARRSGTASRLSGDFTALMNSIKNDNRYDGLKVKWFDQGKSTRITTGVDRRNKFIANIVGGGFSASSQKLLNYDPLTDDYSAFDSVSIIDERGHFQDGLDHLIQKMISLQYAHELSLPVFRGNVGMVNLRSCVIYTAIGWPSKSSPNTPCKFIAYVQSNTRPSSRIARFSTGIGSYISKSQI